MGSLLHSLQGRVETRSVATVRDATNCSELDVLAARMTFVRFAGRVVSTVRLIAEASGRRRAAKHGDERHEIVADRPAIVYAGHGERHAI